MYCSIRIVFGTQVVLLVYNIRCIMKKYTFYILLQLLATNFLFADKRICGSNDHWHQLTQQQPELIQNRLHIEQQTAMYSNDPILNAKKRNVITIPVVVHVVYNTATQNISDAQILSQIAILNQDFRRLNPDFNSTPIPFQAVSADCQFEFVLARRDPNGDSTTGITRTYTPVSTFTLNDNVKKTNMGGKDPWPSTDYLNIWVCRLANGMLGYAQFPGGPALTDGVVCSFRAFGNTGAVLPPYNKGRTCTHEVGHWLNLFHIWGDDGGSCNGSDLVNDTPNQASENYGCPSYPKLSCNNGPHGEMFVNYMDYTDDACMSMFTAGQKMRMDVLFLQGGVRSSILNSLGAQYPNTPLTCGNVNVTNVSTLTHQSATILWDSIVGATQYQFQYRTVGANNWNTFTLSVPTASISNLNANTNYEYQIQTICNGYPSALSPIFVFTTAVAPPQTCGLPSMINVIDVDYQSATISWQPVIDAVSYMVLYKNSDQQLWDTLFSVVASATLPSLIPRSSYAYKIRSVCNYGVSDFSNEMEFNTTSQPLPACTNSYEPNDNPQQSVAISPFTLVASMIDSGGDEDYFSFSTSGNTPKVKVEMSNVPEDYDLRLYNANGILLASSQNARLSPEVCIFNNATNPGSYYVRVNGYNGKYNANSCYNLTVLLSSQDHKEEIITSTQSAKAATFYPIPAKDRLMIELEPGSSGSYHFKLYNMLGQCIVANDFQVEAAYSSTVLTILLESISEGIYVAELTDYEKTTISQKINVQH